MSVKSMPVILIIEDDAAMRQALADFVQANRYDAIVAADAQTALALYDAHAPDLILLDEQLPDGSGIDFCYQVRQRQHKIPILMITAHDTPQTIDAAFEAGVTDFIPKPPHWTVLRHRIQVHLQASYSEQRIEYRNQLLSTLNEAAKAVSSTLDFFEILHKVAQYAAQIVHVNHALVWEWDVESGMATLSATHEGITAEPYAIDFENTLPELYSHCRQSTAPYYISAKACSAATREHLAQFGAQALLVIQLYTAPGVRGYIELLDEDADRLFEPDEIEFMTLLAQQVTMNIRNARLHYLLQQREQQLARRNHFLEILTQVSRAVTSSLDLNNILTQVARACVESLGATSAYISEVDVQNRTIKVITEYISPHASPEERESDLGHVYSIDKDFPNTLAWITSPQPITIFHIDDPALNEKEREHLAKYGAKSVIQIPLKVEPNLPLGIIEVWESREKRKFTREDVAIMQAIANQVSMSIRNAMLHKDLNRYVQTLEERNRELDAYSHTVAHDLKAPLSVIFTYTGLARLKYQDEMPQELANYLAEIRGAAERLNNMIEQLLYLARVTDADETISMINASQAAQNALMRYIDRIREEHIHVEIQEDLPPVFGHLPWLEEVFANLIGNAIKYKGEDNPNPTIRIYGRREGQLVYITVEDNGIGIAETDQQNLFEMFTRVDSNTKQAGFGLGLSIVKRIVTKLGGSITVESELNQGSRFTFTLISAEERRPALP